MTHDQSIKGTGMVVSGRIKIDMKDRILKLQPSQTPFRVFSAKLGRRKAMSAKFEWIEDEFDPRWATLSDSITGGANTEDDIVLATGEAKYFKKWDVIKLMETGEICWITAAPDISNNEINIALVGSGDISPVTAATKIVIVGSGFEEGADKGAEFAGRLTLPYNYTQIHKTDFGVTGTAEATGMFGANMFPWLRAKKGIEHNLDIEMALIFGQRYIDTSTGTHPRRWSGGALYYIEADGTNVDTSAYDSMTIDAVESFCATLFANGAYNSDQKLVFCGQDIITLFNSFALPNYRMKTGETRFGIPIMRYQSAHGELILIKQPLFDNDLVKYALFVDPANLSYVYLNGRDTTLWANVEDPGVDGMEEEYMTECGLEISLPKTHGLWKLT